MSFDQKLGSEFFRVPKLPSDGKGFVIWKDRIELSIRARGLYGHLDGTTTKPADPPTRPAGSTLTAEEVSAIEKHAKDLSQYLQEEAVVYQQIASTIPDSIYLKIKGKETVKDAWDTLKADFEKRSRMVTIDLRRRLQDTKCTESGNMRTHFDTIRTMREELASLGTTLTTEDFSAIILGSLPKSYNQFLSAVTATASVLKKDLKAEDLMQAVLDEYDRRLTRPGAAKEKNADAAFFAGNSRGKPGKRSDRDIECYNCHKKGHRKGDCWAKGGGKEGQGPRSKGKKEEPKRESANTADEEGVWMAVAKDSDDENMADDEFEDFVISTDDLFYFDEVDSDEDDEEDLTDALKHLQVSDTSNPLIQYSYDDLYHFCKAPIDSSDDDDAGAAAITIDSESTSDEEINPYWQNVTIDELQNLGNPAEVWYTDTDSMPDLVTLSDSENSILFTLSRPDSANSMYSEYSNNDNRHAALFSDTEMMDWTIDEAAETSTFDAAMLANTEGNNDGIQTELYDSGASRHMSPYRDHFENYTSITPKPITAADKRFFQAVGKGDLRIKIPNGSSATTILLKDVLHCPDMGLTLVSIGKIAAAGYKVIFKGLACRIYDTKDKVVGQINARNGLYRIDHLATINLAMSGEAREVVTVEELHRRMGHIAPEAAKQMVSSGAVEGIEVDLATTVQHCDSCEYAKATRKPIKKTREAPRAVHFGDEIHSDVWGPSPIQTPGRKEYYVSFTDDHTRWTHLQLLGTKDGTFQAYKDFESWAKLHHSIPTFKTLRSDRGGEYLGKQFSSYLQSQGTTRKLTVHDTPEYNGISERLNRMLLERTRALLHASKLPKNLWGEAVTHVVWLKNRTPTRALPDGKTPYEMLYGKKPNLKNLHEWGTEVWVHTTEGSKLDGRAKVGRWIGFDEVSNGHRIYWPDKRSVTIERSIKFTDNTIIFPSSPVAQPIQGESNSTNENPKNLQRDLDPEDKSETNIDQPKDPEPTYDTEDSQETSKRSTTKDQEQWRYAPLNRVTDELVAARSKRTRIPTRYVRDIQSGIGTADGRPGKTNLPVGMQTVEPIDKSTASINESNTPIEATSEPEPQIEHAMAAAVSEIEAIDPLSLDEAKGRPDWPKWVTAIQEELATLKKAETWEIVERPKERNIVKNKWVFRIKKDAAGAVERYKARLVAKGFTQVFGVDYYDTWAPVAKLGSIRLLLATATQHGWPVDMFDFHSAFLNGELDSNEEVYMELPQGYEEKDPKRYVCKLNKSLYGLKQAGRKWYDALCKALAEIGFKKSEADPAVFYAKSGNDIAILACHVDDCTITGSSKELVQSYKDKLKQKYSLTDLGPANWLLGIKITRDPERRTMSLSQESYIDSILTKFNFTDLKPFSTPMDPSIRFSRDQCPQTIEEIADMKKVPYREAIGSLNYCAVATRPDIAFSVSLLAQFMDNPGRVHWEAVKRIFRYLSGTKNWKLTYGTTDNGLEGYTDADGSSQEHRHAISGYVFLVNGGAISWSSKKQELVTLSTAESEYVAATYAAKEALWLRRIVNEVFEPVTKPMTLYSDSQSAIALTKDGSYHARTKHIDIRYHFIRFVVQNGSIKLIYCPTEEMTADILTKALPNTKAKHFANSLGLHPA